MELSAGVAVRLAALCLDGGGRLGGYPLWETAVRGALLVDLALAGRLTQTDDSVALEDAPTGFAPADALLAAMAVEHERPLDWWIDRGGARLRDIAAANVASGRWAGGRGLLRRRYVDLHPEATERDLARAQERSDGDWTPESAAVAAIARAAGVDGRPAPPPEEVLSATGPVRWICQAVVEHLAETHQRNRLAAGGGGSAGPMF